MTDRLNTLKGKIECEHKAFELTVRRGLAHIREIGRYLIECQEAAKVEGVSFKKWVESEFAGKFSYPTAWNWLNVAKHWDEFSEDELADMTMKEMLKAVADRNRWGGPPPESETPAVEHTSHSAVGGLGRPQPVLAVVPASDEEADGRGDAVGVVESDRCRHHEVAATQPTGGEHESAVAVLPIRAATTTAFALPTSSTTEDRLEMVARELDIPADRLRAALVRLGYLPPAGHL